MVHGTGRLPVNNTTTSIAIRIFSFLLKVLGSCIPGISGGPTWTSPPSITCGMVQIFVGFLLHLIILIFPRFAICSLTFQLLPSYLVSANTILKFFAIFSSFLCINSKVNFLQLATNLPPVHHLRNGHAFCFAPPFFLFFIFARFSNWFLTFRLLPSNLVSANAIVCLHYIMLQHQACTHYIAASQYMHHQLSSAQLYIDYSSAAQRRAVPRGAVACPAVRCGAVSCCAVLFSFEHTVVPGI